MATASKIPGGGQITDPNAPDYNAEYAGIVNDINETKARAKEAAPAIRTDVAPARVEARPTGIYATYAARTEWDTKYAANYNADGTPKSATAAKNQTAAAAVATTTGTTKTTTGPNGEPLVTRTNPRSGKSELGYMLRSGRTATFIPLSSTPPTVEATTEKIPLAQTEYDELGNVIGTISNAEGVVPTKPTTPSVAPPKETDEPKSVNNKQEVNETTLTAKDIEIKPNRLHNYSTYTYGITLHLLTQDSFNAMADGNDWIGLPSTYTLVSSAGRWGDLVKNKNAFHRPSEFSDDFFFDGLSMETIIGLNQQSRATNVIDVNFTLVEPYGLTFMNRLLALAVRLKIPNYLANPYVLQIDFFGSNDAGIEIHPIPDITKFIPIKLLECKIKVGTQGATYACRASPYNHSAWAQTVSSTPVNFEIKAKSVGDFFNNTGDISNIATEAQARSNAAQEREQVSNNTYISQADRDTRTRALTDQINAPYKVKSYTGAYNAYQLYLKNNKTIQQESVLIFKIDADIAGSDLVYPKQTDLKTTPTQDRTDSKTQPVITNPTTKGTPPQKGPPVDIEKFNVNAGTSIVEVINMIMRNSKYITDQVRGNTTVEKLMEDGKPLKWFKIIPKIKLKNYDYSTNTWSHEITVNIIPFTYHNYKHPVASKSAMNEIIKGLRKEYNYIYTGKNDDILDFSIDFDALFYTAVNVLKDNLASLSGADKTLTDQQRNPDGSPTPEALPADVRPDLLKEAQLQFNVIHPVSADQSNTQGFNAWQNTSIQIASDIMKSVYSGARGDMINLKVRIIGDPDFIKQDDIYFNPGNPNYPSEGEAYSPDGSILTDRGDIFCRVRFKTIVDMDQNTGGIRSTLGDNNPQQYLESNFSGVYKIIKVSTELKGGKFEQVLDMIRWPDDPELPPKVVRESAEAGQSSATFAATDPCRLDIARPTVTNSASNEPVKSPPASITPAVRVPARPAWYTALAGQLDWDSKYAANYNRDGTPKNSNTTNSNSAKLKNVADSGEVKDISYQDQQAA